MSTPLRTPPGLRRDVEPLDEHLATTVPEKVVVFQWTGENPEEVRAFLLRYVGGFTRPYVSTVPGTTGHAARHALDVRYRTNNSRPHFTFTAFGDVHTLELWDWVVIPEADRDNGYVMDDATFQRKIRKTAPVPRQVPRAA